MEDDYLPVPSKKRMKRIAAKKQRKEAKRKKIEDLCNLPGTDTITESEATETTTFIDEGTLIHWIQRTCMSPNPQKCGV